METHFTTVLTAPSRQEAEALATVAAYLKRAGNETATRLMTLSQISEARTELMVTLRDEMRDSAALCECLMALFDDWTVTPGGSEVRGPKSGVPITI